MTTGRGLVITGDHGYAATGLFPDAADNQQTQLSEVALQERQVRVRNVCSPGSWVPPIDLTLETPHGQHAFVLGRRKWKSQGGYPTLAHGGLSFLEVAVPFIELSRGRPGADVAARNGKKEGRLARRSRSREAVNAGPAPCT